MDEMTPTYADPICQRGHVLTLMAEAVNNSRDIVVNQLLVEYMAKIVDSINVPAKPRAEVIPLRVINNNNKITEEKNDE